MLHTPLRVKGVRGKPKKGYTVGSSQSADTLYPLIGSLVLTKATPGYAGGEKELIARGGVDKKKSPS